MRQVDADLESFLAGFAEAIRKTGAGRGLKYASPYEAFLAEGLVFQHEPYTPEEEALLLDVFEGTRAWERKRCFFNAQTIALNDGRLQYAEGYVLAHGLPLALEHGWNLLPESGKPVDVTLRETGEEATCDPGELLARASRNLAHAYRGMVIPAEEVRKHWVRTGRSESLTQDPSGLRRIMTRGFPGTWGRRIVE